MPKIVKIRPLTWNREFVLLRALVWSYLHICTDTYDTMRAHAWIRNATRVPGWHACTQVVRPVSAIFGWAPRIHTWNTNIGTPGRRGHAHERYRRRDTIFPEAISSISRWSSKKFTKHIRSFINIYLTI